MNALRILIAAIVLIAALLALPGWAEAYDDDIWRDLSIDVGATSSTGPGSEWDTGPGLSIGVVYRISASAGLRVGAEQHRFNSNKNQGYTYSRLPVFLGGRFYFWNMGSIWSEADLGLEISMDKREYCCDLNNNKTTESQNNIGGAAQYGLLYEISDHLFMGLGIKAHLNKNTYWTYGINLGMVF